VDDVAEELFQGLDRVAFSVFDRSFGANERLSEEVKRTDFVLRGIDWKSDAIGRGGIVKKFLMKKADLLFHDKVDDDLIGGNLEFFK